MYTFVTQQPPRAVCTSLYFIFPLLLKCSITFCSNPIPRLTPSHLYPGNKPKRLEGPGGPRYLGFVEPPPPPLSSSFVSNCAIGSSTRTLFLSDCSRFDVVLFASCAKGALAMSFICSKLFNNFSRCAFPVAHMCCSCFFACSLSFCFALKLIMLPWPSR